MNEKRSLQDLIDLLAEKHELSKKEAEAVVKGMFDLIEEALEREKYVKVKGLGTFKLTEVDRRESVDVNTGERIEIQGHTKVSFTPDTSMKDQINKPFAHFETVILNEGTQLEDTVTETEEELAEELRTENDAEEPVVPTSSPVSTSPETVAAVSVEVDAPSPGEETASVVSGSKADSMAGAKAAAAAVSEEKSTARDKSPVEATTGIEQMEVSAGASEREAETAAPAVKKTETEVASLTIVAKKVEITSEQVTTRCVTWEESPLGGKSSSPEEAETSVQGTPAVEPELLAASAENDTLATYRRWIWILSILLLLALSVGVYLFVQQRTPSSSSVSAPEPIEVIAVDSIRPVDSLFVRVDSTETEVVEQEVQAENAQGQSDEHRPAVLSDTLEYDITGTLTNHILKEGESLIKISLKYFGNKELWPYIVKHNAGVIRDANRVPIGTQLRIPKLSPRR